MQLAIGDRVLEFKPVSLRFESCVKTDLFARKNNKTVAETLVHLKYSHLMETVIASHSESLDRKLGDFVYDLKAAGDLFYKRFLNAYGDDTFCEFLIDNAAVARLMGLYCFVVDGDVKYIGKSVDSFGKRINQGYGRIHPKNCYRDGQATNCHLNGLVAKCRDRVTFFVCPMRDLSEIDASERVLILREKPEWNIRLKGWPKAAQQAAGADC